MPLNCPLKDDWKGEFYDLKFTTERKEGERRSAFIYKFTTLCVCFLQAFWWMVIIFNTCNLKNSLQTDTEKEKERERGSGRGRGRGSGERVDTFWINWRPIFLSWGCPLRPGEKPHKSLHGQVLSAQDSRERLDQWQHRPRGKGRIKCRLPSARVTSVLLHEIRPLTRSSTGRRYMWKCHGKTPET